MKVSVGEPYFQYLHDRLLLYYETVTGRFCLAAPGKTNEQIYDTDSIAAKVE